jgi:hypothetical protein
VSFLLIACKTIQEEIAAAGHVAGAAPATVFLESGLHIVPEKLRRRLQDEIDRAGPDVSHILLGYGYCGNAVEGLSSRDKTIVLPKADDCITLLLGSTARREAVNREAAYFLTRGWIDNHITIWDEYQLCLQQYGEKKTRIIMQSMLGHYRRLALLNTGLPEGGDWREITARMASVFSLETIAIDGTHAWLEKLLAGRWDEDFLLFPPGRQIDLTRMLTG